MKEKELHITITVSALHNAFFVLLTLGALFLFSAIATATTPNPGHPWTDVGDGTFQVTGPTSLRTYTFPDANATVLTSNAQASTTLLSCYGPCYFGATATSSFSTAGVLSLASALSVGNGGSGAATLSGLLIGNGSSAFTATTLSSGISGQLSDETGSGSLVFSASPTITGLASLANASSTLFSVTSKSYFGATATSTFDSAGVLTLVSPLALTSGGTNASLSAVNGGVLYSGASAFAVSAAGSSGQILTSAGAATPVWTTATYPATSGTAGQVLMSNGTNWVSTATTTPTITSIVTRPISGMSTGAITATTTLQLSLTVRDVGLFTIPGKITVNQISFSTAAGTTGTAKVCVYSEDGATKYIDVTSGTLAVGNNSVAVSAVTLSAGNYYIAVGCSTTCTSNTLNVYTSTVNALLNTSVPAGKEKYEGRVTHASGGCDATLGTITGMSSAVPLVRLDN
jgi:hypothetical protein